MSELHLNDISKEDKLSWIHASRQEQKSLADWVVYHLNEAVKEDKDFEWLKIFSDTTQKALVRNGFISFQKLCDEFESLPALNFTPDQLQEIREKM